jgi:hypothetical protein
MIVGLVWFGLSDAMHGLNASDCGTILCERVDRFWLTIGGLYECHYRSAITSIDAAKVNQLAESKTSPVFMLKRGFNKFRFHFVSLLLLALRPATEKKIAQHEAFANKKHSTNETFFFFCACQHAKPFVSRHFTQSQATREIAIDARI